MKNKKIFWWILAICCIGFPVFCTASEDEGRTVRIGICGSDGYYRIDQSENQRAYDYEYLTEISKYTGWKYEFVEASRHECATMLRRGEIDLLGGVEKTKSRERTMSFGATPYMYVANCLLIERDSDTYAYEDFEAFDGMRVGGLRGSSMNYYLKEYAKENGFDYTLSWYDSEEALKKALRRQEIDSVFLNDFRNLGDYSIIGRFGYSAYYYASSVRSTRIKEELDEALKQIHTRNHYYESELYSKYFTEPIQLAFTKDEKAFIRDNRYVQVALFDGFPLICEYDEERKRYNGIIMDALDALSKRTGLKFTYTKMPADVLPWDYMEEHPNTVVAPFLRNSLIDYVKTIKMLDTIVEGRMVAVKMTGRVINLGEEFVLAIPANMYRTETEMKRLFPRAEIVECGSHEEGLDMVRNGAADMTFVNEITGAHMPQSPYYENLSVVNMDRIFEDITVAVGSTTSPLLVSILNKGISTFSERDIRQIVVDNTASSSYHLSLNEWIYKNKLLITLAVLLFTGTGIAVQILKRQNRHEKEEEQRARLAEERYQADQIYKKQLFHEANFDKLTGLYNQGYFVEKAGELMEANPDKVYAFMRINIVKFKMINEIFGKERGDYILLMLADKLRNDIGENGVYGRLHSDNFVVCYPITEESLHDFPRVSTVHVECQGQTIRVEIQVGIYVNTKHETDVEHILDYVRIALENKAESGDAHFHFFKDAYFENMLRSQKITNEMDHALRDEEFQVFLQPQFDHISGTLVGAEALVRWFHPVEGMIPPNDFIPVFEGNRFICRLDAYICEKACQLLAKWKNNGKMVPISVNLSRLDLQNRDLVQRLTALLEKYSIPASCLHLEITESAYVENDTELLQVIEELRNAGFVIEMDDFGSGYSSLNMLKDIPVDILKLDMKFFSGETHMDKGGNIIEAMVKLAHSLGLVVIAEGVETEREANFLKSIPCSVVQGYLYGKPVPVADFEKLLCESRVGEKHCVSAEGGSFGSKYWDLEKYNVLIQKDGAALFDYDPFMDCATFTYIENGQRVDKTVLEFAQRLPRYQRIHPDYRKWLKELLDSKEQGAEEAEFKADYKGDGKYEMFHANLYYYFRRGDFSRLIAVIRKKEGSF